MHTVSQAPHLAAAFDIFCSRVTMYETHLGLTSNPFASKATGAAVFVGPQQAEIMRRLSNGMQPVDSVVTVTGPVGVGKTTIVNRALESMSPGRLVAWVGRMHLSEAEVLDLLLAGFGVSAKSANRIQRFAAFRRILSERCRTGPRVAVVVEDAERLGVDALAELEALTADENGDGVAANIILMGRPTLNDLLATPEMARMRQRTRLRQTIGAFSAAETRGYLKHAIRAAGGDYDAIFDASAAEKIIACAEGIPRVVNSVCEMALTQIAELGQQTVSPTLISEIAEDALGFADTDASPAEPEDVSRTDIAEPSVRVTEEAKTSAAAEETDGHSANEPFAATVTPIRTAELVPDTAVPEREIAVESGQYPDPESSSYPADCDATDRMRTIEAARQAAEHTAEDDFNPDEVPDLINDTQPSLPTLACHQAAAAVVIDTDEPDTADIPVLTVGEDSTVRAVAQVDQPDANYVESAEQAAEVAMQVELDAALSIELDSTNVMEGLTRDLENVSTNLRSDQDRRFSEIDDAEHDELPTLSSSMRVHTLPDAATASSGTMADHADNEMAEESQAEKSEEEQLAEDLSGKAAPTEEIAPDAVSAEMRDDESADKGDGCFSLEDTFSRRTNIDVLEAALKEAKTFDITGTPALIPEFHDAKPADEPGDDVLPDIILDDALPVAAEVEKAADADVPAVADDKPQVNRYAEAIGKAQSLEDISDLMAETLFGTEFEQIAAEAVAMRPEGLGELQLEAEPASPVRLDEAEHSVAANTAADVAPKTTVTEEAPKPAAEKPKSQVSTGDILRRAAAKSNGASHTPAPQLPDGDQLKESVAMRIEMLNAMKNGTPVPASRPSVVPAPDQRADDVPPEPIENQIDTSLTATLQTLSLANMQAAEEDEKEKKTGGLFARFRKSS